MKNKIHRIEIGSKRYRLAQWCLRLIFGPRKNPYFISPWQNAGATAAVFMHYDKKILFGLRAGNVEYVGKWSHVGGHVDMDLKETFAEAAIREAQEETGIDISDIMPPTPFDTAIIHEVEYKELSNMSVVKQAFFVPLSKYHVEKLKPTEEMSDYKFLSFDEYQEMLEKNMIVGNKRFQKRAFELIRR